MIAFGAIGMLLASVSGADAEKRIGLSVPLTGAAETLARQYVIGAKLAVSRFEQAGSEKITLIIADDGCESALADLAAAELLEAKVDLVSGLLCNEAATVMANRFANVGTPLLVAGARSERLIKDRERETWNLWRLSPGDSDASRFAGEILSKAWTGKAYAIIDHGTVYGRNLADGFRVIIEEKGVPPQFQDNFRPTQSTQARVVRRLQRAGITHVFIGSSAEDVAMIAKNAAELDIPLQIAGGEVLSIMPYLSGELQPPAGLLAIVEKSAVDLELPPHIGEFFTQNNIQPENAVLAGYQSMEIAMAAMGKNSWETTRNLATKTFETLLGPVGFTKDGRNSGEQYGLYTWTGTQFEQMGQ